MKKPLAPHEREPANVLSALDELHEAERRANAAKEAYAATRTASAWRTFCEAAVGATSARAIAEAATGLRLRRVEGGRFHTVVET